MAEQDDTATAPTVPSDPDRTTDQVDGRERAPGRRRLRTVVKWAWVLVVVGVAGAVLVDRWGAISEQVRDLSVGFVLLGVALTAAAKLLLGENARLAANAHDVRIGRETAVRLYNLSQLGKYLPGSVWQFIGRAAAYRDLGARPGPIRDAIVTESLWLVGGAATMGLLLSGFGVVPVVVRSLDPRLLLWIGVGLGAAALLVLVLALTRGRALLGYVRRSRPTLPAVVVQAGVWTLLGLSLVAFGRAAGIDVPVTYAIGLFAVAFAVGFVVLFAPAGLGVRDGILTLGLLPYAPAEQGLVVVLVARLVYVAVELLLVLVQEVLPRRSAPERLS